jgi:hypothetical protein
VLSTATQSVAEGQDTATTSSPGSMLSAADQVPAVADGVGVVGPEVGEDRDDVGISVPPAGGEDPGEGLDEVPQAATMAPASMQAKIPAPERRARSLRSG